MTSLIEAFIYASKKKLNLNIRPRFCPHRCFVFPGRPAYLRAALSFRAEIAIVHALDSPGSFTVH